MSDTHRREDGVSSLRVPSEVAARPEPVTEGASYVQLLPEGWAWYRLQTLEQGKYELCLIQTDIPEFTFECLRLDDAASGNAEAEFSAIINDRGLMYVDASPTISERWCAEIAGIIQELNTKKSAIDTSRKTAARWFETLQRALGFGSGESANQPLESEVEAIRMRLREACFQANEEVEARDSSVPEQDVHVATPPIRIEPGDRARAEDTAPKKRARKTPAAKKGKETPVVSKENSPTGASDRRNRLAEVISRLTAAHPENFKSLLALRDVPLDAIWTTDMPETLRDALVSVRDEASRTGCPSVDHETVSQFISRWAACPGADGSRQ